MCAFWNSALSKRYQDIADTNLYKTFDTSQKKWLYRKFTNLHLLIDKLICFNTRIYNIYIYVMSLICVYINIYINTSIA